LLYGSAVAAKAQRVRTYESESSGMKSRRRGRRRDGREVWISKGAVVRSVGPLWCNGTPDNMLARSPREGKGAR
jgi:hypothetical protein